MTKETLKHFLSTIESAKDPLNRRWRPDLLCEMIDNLTYVDVANIVPHPTCTTCVHNTDNTCWEPFIGRGDLQLTDTFYCSVHLPKEI